MMTRYFFSLGAALTAVGLAAAPARATVRLPALVGSHMVLQRNRLLPVWGWAAPGEAVTLTFRGKAYRATPDATGRWQATLPPQPAGGPFTLTVKGENTIELTDVLVGDVWLASGQSNMEMKVKDNAGGYQPVQQADQEIAAANYPTIRLFNVGQTVGYRAQTEVQGTGWRVCSPATIADFSATAYFFGRDVYQQYQVPIGLIASCWGGTPAEAWVSADGLRNFPDFRAQANAFIQRTTSPAADQRAYEEVHTRYRATLNTRDNGSRPDGKTWAAFDLDTRAWPTMALPANWETTPGLTEYDGVVWFRKEVDLSAADAGHDLTLSLGPIDDADSTWFNGVKVGSTTGYDVPRTYTVPAGLVRPGRNVIAVRVLDTSSGGGLWGAPDALRLATATRTLPLAGPWQYQPGSDPRDMPKSPTSGNPQNAPTTLYNGMIAPLLPYAIKGVVWYQGESNVGRAAQYRALFPALIADWRTQWGYSFPFLFVQLANYLQPQPQPSESGWAELREAQAQTLAVPHTGMATAIDIGEADDIHPHNKQAVGRRLALAARHVAYADEAVVYSGPTYASMAVAGRTVRVKFAHCGTGLLVPDGPLRGFAVAGANQKFYWATAQVQGAEVVLTCPAVPAPVAVRYDWADNPNGNLTNREGLPAVPFRTDKGTGK